MALLNRKGLAADYEVRQSEGGLAQVEATIPVLRTSLDASLNALDVVLALSALVNRQQQAQSLAQGEASLAQARRSSFMAYQKGAASLINVLNADQQLLRASDSRAVRA